MKRFFILLLSALMVVGTIDARKMSDLKIYINPGHGGYGSDDRPIQIHPFEKNDTNGYWESKSNLVKGLFMYHILDSLGTTAYLSRIKNTEADDRSLSGIGREATNLGCDAFLSIHTNAGETVNFPLMLYRENSIGVPRYEGNITMSEIMGTQLYSSKLSIWTRQPQVSGDLTFYQNMWEGGLGVLRNLYVVGLLSEGGMHEHQPEAHRLMNVDFCWLEAWHFVRGLMEYFNTEDRFVTGNVAGIVYDEHRLREAIMPTNFTRFGRDNLAPLNGASVVLLDSNGEVVQTRTTDDMYNGVFVFRNVKPGNYVVKASRDDYYTLEQAVTVTANEVTYNDMPMMLKREFPLAITSYTPVVGENETVSCAVTPEFSFNTDVNTETFEAAFHIDPPVSGYFEYSEANTKVRFIPDVSFTQSTTYTITVDASARHHDTKYHHPQMEAPLVLTFTTSSRDRVSMVDQFPRDGGKVHCANPLLEFRFDYEINPSNAFDVISIKSSTGKSVALNKRYRKNNTLSNGFGNIIYSVNENLTPGETYTLTISTDLRDRENLPLDNPIEIDFTAEDVTDGVEAGTVIEDFEASGISFTYNAERSTGIGNILPTAVRSTSDKLLGKASGKFTYKFIDYRNGDITWDCTGLQQQFNTGDRLALYINGDFNSHRVYAIFVSGTDTKYVDLGIVDFLGWQRREAVLDMLDPTYPYTFGGIRLVQETSKITQNGTFCIDDITWLGAASGVEDIEINAEITAYPLPASGTLNVNAPEDILSLDLYSASGMHLMSEQNSNSLVLGATPPGVYFLKVKTATRTATLRIPVR